MTNPDEINVDDLVTQDQLDDLQDAIDGLQGGQDDDETPDDGEPTMPWDDADDAPFTTPDDVQDAADQTFMKRLQHLVDEECDTPECEHLRDALNTDPSGAGSSEGGADADADGDDEGNDESDGGGSESSTDGDTSGESSDPATDDGDDAGGDSETDGDDTYTPPWEQ